MQNSKGNQQEETSLSCTTSDQDLTMSDYELDALGTQLEVTVPGDIVDLTFRDSLLSKLIDIQSESKHT
jgi:hypothetical protein